MSFIKAVIQGETLPHAFAFAARYNSGCHPYPRDGDIWVFLAGDLICLEGKREAWGAVGPGCV